MSEWGNWRTGELSRAGGVKNSLKKQRERKAVVVVVSLLGLFLLRGAQTNQQMIASLSLACFGRRHRAAAAAAAAAFPIAVHCASNAHCSLISACANARAFARPAMRAEQKHAPTSIASQPPSFPPGASSNPEARAARRHTFAPSLCGPPNRRKVS